MIFLRHVTKRFNFFTYPQIRALGTQLGDLGCGVSKGGGGGGTIREAGGSFGKNGASSEEKFIYNQQKNLLQKLKSDLHDKGKFPEEELKCQQDTSSNQHQKVPEMNKA